MAVYNLSAYSVKAFILPEEFRRRVQELAHYYYEFSEEKLRIRDWFIAREEIRAERELPYAAHISDEDIRPRAHEKWNTRKDHDADRNWYMAEEIIGESYVSSR